MSTKRRMIFKKSESSITLEEAQARVISLAKDLFKAIRELEALGGGVWVGSAENLCRGLRYYLAEDILARYWRGNRKE